MLSSLSPFHGWSPAAPYALALMLAALLCALLAVLGWRRRAKPGGPQFTAMMAGAAVWALLYAFELLSPTLASKVVWAKLEYLGIATLPLAWFLFTCSYTGTQRRLGRGLLALVTLIPALTLVLVATNEFHRLVWNKISLSTSGSFPSLVLTHGPWFWVHVIYSYGLLAVGSFLLIRTVFRYPQLYRKQAGMLMIAIAAPWVGNALSVFGVLPAGSVDPTPFAFTITGLALTLSMSRFRLFSLLPALLPTARNQVLQEMKDGVLVLDVDGRVMTVNPAAGRMLGGQVSELVGKPAVEILGDGAAVLTAADDKESETRFEITLGEGTLQRSYDVVSSAVGLRAGVDMGRLLVLRDISERKKTEEALLLTQLSVDRSADLVHWVSPEGDILYVNDLACLRHGYTREEMISMRLWDLDAELSPEVWQKRWDQIKKRGFSVFEVTHRAKSGELFPLEVTSNYIKHGDKEYEFAFMHDITERKRAEEALSKSEKRYRTLFASANDIVTIHDFAGRILEVNNEATERLGYTHDELLGMTVIDIRTPEAAGLLRTQMDGLRRVGRAVFETEHQRRDGSHMPVEVSSCLIDYGDAQAVLSIARDLTERKRAEQALREREDQLRQAQKMEAIGQLAGGIAHDFNNLLTAIIGYSDLILASSEGVGDSLRGDVQEIKAAADRASALTRQILAFSRRQALQPEVVSLNEIVASTERLLCRTLGEDIDLVTLLRPELELVEVDASQFEQVLMNLALNSRDAMPNGGKLTIETANVELSDEYCGSHLGARVGLYVMLAVSDTGVGMDEETRSRVFEPFFTTKEPGRGTGLGLSTVYGTVKQSGGSVFVYSEVGAGTTVKIYLPRVDQPKKRRSVKVRRPDTVSGNETILVVEDEKAVRDLAGRILQRSGYKVISAANGDDALALLEDCKCSVDMLLTDVVLPGTMQGNELARAVGVLCRELPVLYMSGYTRDAIVHAGRLDEGVNYLEKPFTPGGLAHRVREVLDCQAAAQ